jgi:hypothetical protein
MSNRAIIGANQVELYYATAPVQTAPTVYARRLIHLLPSL